MSADWPTFYRELVHALLEYENRQPELVNLLESAGVNNGTDWGQPLQEIDPLTFLSLISKHRNVEKWQQVLSKLKDDLNLQAEVPEDGTGLPHSDPRSSWLFAFGEERAPEDIPTLWKLTREAVQGAIQPETFARALEIKHVGLSKLTMALFWLDAERYLALNSKNIDYLSKLGLPDAGNVNSLQAYEAVMERAKHFSPTFLELSHSAWSASQSVEAPSIFPFKEFRDEVLGYRNDVDALTTSGEIKEAQNLLLQGQGELHLKYGRLLAATVRQNSLSKLTLDETVRYSGKQDFDVKLGFQPLLEGVESKFFQSILYLSSESRRPGLNFYCGFTGGKAYEAQIRKALQQVGQIEKLVAVLVDTDRLPTQPQLHIHKSLSGMKHEFFLKPEHAQELRELLDVYVRAEGQSQKLEVQLWVTPEQLASYEYPDLMAETLSYFDGFANFAYSLLASQPQTTSPIVTPSPLSPFVLPELPRNIVLYGPPGTGKTYNLARLALERLEPDFLLTEPPPTRIEIQKRLHHYQQQGQVVFTTFHQSFSYEDFIEGIKPVPPQEGQSAPSYRLEDGLLKRLALKAQRSPSVNGAADDEPKAHVLIIDEINRGNVAKIFGELITLLEGSKRQGRMEETLVELPYSKQPFSLPDNLFFIGTMNTADQSLARIDSALRRRFEFVEMAPKPELLPMTADGIDLHRMLYVMNRRITLLQSKDYALGHAYFMDLSSNSYVEDVSKVFRQRILPLLEEYFFDDWDRIRAVLNDDDKTDENQIVIAEEGTSWLPYLDRVGDTYTIQDSALMRVQAYKGIYESNVPAPE